MNLITLDNVSLGYEGKAVIQNVQLSIQEQQYICIIGSNGSGKSTLIKAILGLQKPLSGDILFTSTFQPKEIGYLPQQTTNQKDFPASVLEVVSSGTLNTKQPLFFYSKEAKQKVKESLQMLGIYDLRHKSFRELSGGQQQKVLLARALCATKKVLILDEPVTGLDPQSRDELYALISKLHKEKNITIIMISHDVEEAITYASEIIVVKDTQATIFKTNDYVAQLTKGGSR